MAEDPVKAVVQSASPGQIGASALQALIPGIISLFSKDRQRSHEKRYKQLKQTDIEKKYGFGMANINRAEDALLREQERAPGGISARMASIGAIGGSQEQQAIRDQDYRFKTRMNQLQQQRAELKWGKEYGEEVRSLHDSVKELEDKEFKINALVQTGLFVAGAALGGGTPAGIGAGQAAAGQAASSAAGSVGDLF